MSHEEYVLKRNGEKQPVSFDKILFRIKALSHNDLNINLLKLTAAMVKANTIKNSSLYSHSFDLSIAFLSIIQLLEFQKKISFKD